MQVFPSNSTIEAEISLLGGGSEVGEHLPGEGSEFDGPATARRQFAASETHQTIHGASGPIQRTTQHGGGCTKVGGRSFFVTEDQVEVHRHGGERIAEFV